MTEKPKHVHKLKRLKYKSGNTIFFCALPDCPFKTNIALALGKRSLCWRCGEPFIMTEYSLRLAKPHCDNCHRPKGEPSNTEIYNEENYEASKYEPELTLADRLQQTIQQHQVKEDEDEI